MTEDAAFLDQFLICHFVQNAINLKKISSSPYLIFCERKWLNQEKPKNNRNAIIIRLQSSRKQANECAEK